MSLNRRLFVSGLLATSALFVPMSLSEAHAAGLELVFTDLIWHISATGSDVTGDGSIGAPFQTLQHAYDHAADTLHLAGGTITFQLPAGTFVGLATSRRISGAGVPADVTVKGVGDSTALTKSFATGCIELGISAAGIATMLVDSLTVYAPAGMGLVSYGAGCALEYKNINFGVCQGHQVQGAHNTWVAQVGPCKISGSAYSHMAAETNAVVAPHGGALTILAAVTFSGAFAYCTAAQLHAAGMTFTNGNLVSGRRYFVANFGILGGSNGDPNYFPGTIAGINQNGIYA